MSFDSNTKRDMVTQMMDFENGDLVEQQTIELFQQLIDSGTVWHLQGFVGYCNRSEESHQDASGNVPPLDVTEINLAQ